MPPNSIKGALYNPEVYIRLTYQQSSQRPDRGKDSQNGSLFGLSLVIAPMDPSLDAIDFLSEQRVKRMRYSDRCGHFSRATCS
jgi:hypothetical protein